MGIQVTEGGLRVQMPKFLEGRSEPEREGNELRLLVLEEKVSVLLMAECECASLCLH